MIIITTIIVTTIVVTAIVVSVVIVFFALNLAVVYSVGHGSAAVIEYLQAVNDKRWKI